MKNRRKPLQRLIACLLLQTFLTFDAAWAAGPQGFHTMRGEALEQSAAKSGLEEQLKGPARGRQGRLKSAWFATVATVLLLGLPAFGQTKMPDYSADTLPTAAPHAAVPTTRLAPFAPFLQNQRLSAVNVFYVTLHARDYETNDLENLQNQFRGQDVQFVLVDAASHPDLGLQGKKDGGIVHINWNFQSVGNYFGKPREGESWPLTFVINRKGENVTDPLAGALTSQRLERLASAIGGELTHREAEAVKAGEARQAAALKVQQDRQEVARKAVAADQAEKARLTKIAADQAEKARLAQIAADQAAAAKKAVTPAPQQKSSQPTVTKSSPSLTSVSLWSLGGVLIAIGTFLGFRRWLNRGAAEQEQQQAAAGEPPVRQPVPEDGEPVTGNGEQRGVQQQIVVAGDQAGQVALHVEKSPPVPEQKLPSPLDLARERAEQARQAVAEAQQRPQQAAAGEPPVRQPVPEDGEPVTGNGEQRGVQQQIVAAGDQAGQVALHVEKLPLVPEQKLPSPLDLARERAEQARQAVAEAQQRPLDYGAISVRAHEIWNRKKEPGQEWQDQAGQDADWARAETALRAEAVDAAHRAHLHAVGEYVGLTFPYNNLVNAQLLASDQGYQVSPLDRSDAQSVIPWIEGQGVSAADAPLVLAQSVTELTAQREREAAERTREEQRHREENDRTDRKTAQAKVVQLVNQVENDDDVRQTARYLTGSRLFNEGPHVTHVLTIADGLGLDQRFITIDAVEQAIATVAQQRAQREAEAKVETRETVKTQFSYDTLVNAQRLHSGQGFGVSNLEKPAAESVIPWMINQGVPAADAPLILDQAIENLAAQRQVEAQAQTQREAEQQSRADQAQRREREEAQPMVVQLVREVGTGPATRTAQYLAGRRLSPSQGLDIDRSAETLRVLGVADRIGLDQRFITPQSVQPAISTVAQERRQQQADQQGVRRTAKAAARERIRLDQLNRATDMLAPLLNSISSGPIGQVAQRLRKDRVVESPSKYAQILQMAQVVATSVGLPDSEVPVLLDAVVERRKASPRSNGQFPLVAGVAAPLANVELPASPNEQLVQPVEAVVASAVPPGAPLDERAAPPPFRVGQNVRAEESLADGRVTQGRVVAAGRLGSFNADLALQRELGGRKNQEDSDAFDIVGPEGKPQGVVLVLADGIGGLANGEVASREVTDTILKHAKQPETSELVRNYLLADEPGKAAQREGFQRELQVIPLVEAHRKVFSQQPDPSQLGQEDMGSTAAILHVIGDEALVATVGDSRIYLYREGRRLQQLTPDDSLAWDILSAKAEKLFSQVPLPLEEYRGIAAAVRGHHLKNFLTQNIGRRSEEKENEPADLHPHLYHFKLQPGDQLLANTDGLSLPDPVIEKVLKLTADRSAAQQTVQLLMRLEAFQMTTSGDISAEILAQLPSIDEEDRRGMNKDNRTVGLIKFHPAEVESPAAPIEVVPVQQISVNRWAEEALTRAQQSMQENPSANWREIQGVLGPITRNLEVRSGGNISYAELERISAEIGDKSFSAGEDDLERGIFDYIMTGKKPAAGLEEMTRQVGTLTKANPTLVGYVFDAGFGLASVPRLANVPYFIIAEGISQVQQLRAQKIPVVNIVALVGSLEEKNALLKAGFPGDNIFVINPEVSREDNLARVQRITKEWLRVLNGAEQVLILSVPQEVRTDAALLMRFLNDRLSSLHSARPLAAVGLEEAQDIQRLYGGEV